MCVSLTVTTERLKINDYGVNCLMATIHIRKKLAVTTDRGLSPVDVSHAVEVVGLPGRRGVVYGGWLEQEPATT